MKQDQGWRLVESLGGATSTAFKWGVYQRVQVFSSQDGIEEVASTGGKEKKPQTHDPYA